MLVDLVIVVGVVGCDFVYVVVDLGIDCFEVYVGCLGGFGKWRDDLQYRFWLCVGGEVEIDFDVVDGDLFYQGVVHCIVDEM